VVWVDLNTIHVDLPSARPNRSHLSQVSDSASEALIPVRWIGVHPFQDYEHSAHDRTVGAVPLIIFPRLPTAGTPTVTSELKISPCILFFPRAVLCRWTSPRISRGSIWRSEFERPIYFVETRNGFVCCWCHVSRDRIVLQSHPLSPVPVRTLKHPQEAEVIGQVVERRFVSGGGRCFIPSQSGESLQN